MRRDLGLLVVLAMLLGACAGDGALGDPEGEPSGSGGTAAEATAVPLCEDLAPVSPPDEHLRDEPIYVANEQPMQELLDWASPQPGFEELWIDRDHLGWVVLAFSEDADARQAELTERFPDVGAAVVGVDWTLDELLDLQRRVSSELGYSNEVSIIQGVVAIGVGVMTEERLDEVAEHFAGERVCVEGIDPADAPDDGPQATAGDGWRLLADETVGETYRTGIAADEEGYARLWDEVGLTAEPPAVDFEIEVVIWFGAVYSSSCPGIRLDDVVVDEDRALVHADIVEVDTASVCTADANPRAFVVAVERAVLPVGPFAIQLGAEPPPPGAPEERTLVDAHLDQPGASLPLGATGADPQLAEPAPYTVGPGDIVEDGYPADYRLDLHCGPEWLGPLNDVLWRSDTTDTPAAWREAIDPSTEVAVVEVLVETDPARLTATLNDHGVVYEPTAEEHPGCD